jgi:hypothetical protein
MCSAQFRIDPLLRIRAGTHRSLNSIEEAIGFLSAWSGRRPGPDWGDVLSLLESVRTREQVAGATTALRALLERHGLLVAETEQPDHAGPTTESWGRFIGSEAAEDGQWHSEENCSLPSS